MTTNDCIMPVDKPTVLPEVMAPLRRDINFEGTFSFYSSACWWAFIDPRSADMIDMVSRPVAGWLTPGKQTNKQSYVIKFPIHFG